MLGDRCGHQSHDEVHGRQSHDVGHGHHGCRKLGGRHHDGHLNHRNVGDRCGRRMKGESRGHQSHDEVRGHHGCRMKGVNRGHQSHDEEHDRHGCRMKGALNEHRGRRGCRKTGVNRGRRMKGVSRGLRGLLRCNEACVPEHRCLRHCEVTSRDRGLHDHRSFHESCGHPLLNLDDRSVQLVLRQVEPSDLATALKGVAEAVRDFVGTALPSDDITMLAVRRLAPAAA